MYHVHYTSKEFIYGYKPCSINFAPNPQNDGNCLHTGKIIQFGGAYFYKYFDKVFGKQMVFLVEDIVTYKN